MDAKLFKKIKKLAKNNGKVIIIDEYGKDAFVIQSLEDYENQQMDWDAEENWDEEEDDEEGEEREFWESSDFAPPIPFEIPDMVEPEKETDDVELMKKVNEDIAVWRAEEEKKETPKAETKPAPAVQMTINEPEAESVLTEEERYYLEPLE
jgi:hypothetical protein